MQRSRPSGVSRRAVDNCRAHGGVQCDGEHSDELGMREAGLPPRDSWIWLEPCVVRALSTPEAPAAGLPDPHLGAIHVNCPVN